MLRAEVNIPSKGMLFWSLMSENLRIFVLDTSTLAFIMKMYIIEKSHIYICTLWELRVLKHKKQYCLWYDLSTVFLLVCL